MTSAPIPPAQDEPSPAELAARLARAQRRATTAQRARVAAEDRAQAAEEAYAQVEEQLVEALTELEILRDPATTAPTSPPAGRDSTGQDESPFGLFQEQLTSHPSLVADGSDPGVLPIALGGTALVGTMVVFLAALNGNLFTPFGLAIVAITAMLAYFAWMTRVERIEVQLSKGGVVYVERSSSGSLRFDLRHDATRVTMSGDPGTQRWEMTFARGGVGSFTVTSAMVDSNEFVRGVRAYRPDL